MLFVFCKQKTAYEMRISDWSSDVCSSDLLDTNLAHQGHGGGIAVLGDLLDDQCRVEHGQVRAAVFLGNRHAQYTDFGQIAQVVPRKGAVQVFHGPATEIVATPLANGYDKPSVLGGKL